MKKYQFILLLILLHVVAANEVLAQVVFIPPYARISLSYYNGAEQRITALEEDGSSDNGSVFERSVPLANFGLRFGYGVFTSARTRLQAEGSFSFWQNKNYDWRSPPGIGLTSRSLRFSKPGTSSNLNFLLSGYYDFDRLNQYASGSWTPYIGGGFGFYGTWRPVFDLRLASDSEGSGSPDDNLNVVDATILDSKGEDTGLKQKVVLSSSETALSIGPMGMLEAGVSYNFSNYIVETYGRAEYLFSFREEFPSELIFTLNFGLRL